MDYGEALVPGIVLDSRFQVEAVLGRGGFGISYLAVEKTTGRKVAIKEYCPDFCAFRQDGVNVAPITQRVGSFDKFRDEFRSESLALSGFDHPNIVKVLHRFDSNGTSYFVMEYVEGQSLNEAAKRPLSVQETMLLAEKLIDGLSAVHDNGLLHRDIKPSNILLASNQTPPETRLPLIDNATLLRFGRPVLLDFGAARSFGVDGATMTGMATPGFGAPEQSMPRARQDVRTDIYGLGATLYFCLSAEAIQDSLGRMQEDRLAPAQQRFASIAPPNFLRAIDRSLRLSAAERPKDVRTFRSELFADLNIGEWTTPEDIKHFVPIGTGPYSASATPANLTDYDAEPPRKTPWLLAFTAVASIFALALVGAYFVGARPSNGILYGSSPAGLSSEGDREVMVRRIEAQMDLMIRLISIAEVSNEDILIHRTTLSAAQAEGMIDVAMTASKAIRSREEDIAKSLEDAKRTFGSLVLAAQDEPRQFHETTARLARQQSELGNLNAARRFATIADIVSANSGKSEVDEAAFLSFWLIETGAEP